MDKEIALQSKVESVAANGERAGAWTTYDTVWATVRETPAREVVTAGAEQAQKRLVFYIYWHDAVSERHCVSYNGSLYDIENIREIGYRAGMELSTVRHQG